MAGGELFYAVAFPLFAFGALRFALCKVCTVAGKWPALRRFFG